MEEDKWIDVYQRGFVDGIEWAIDLAHLPIEDMLGIMRGKAEEIWSEIKESWKEEQLDRCWDGRKYQECHNDWQKEYTRSLFDVCGTMRSMYQQKHGLDKMTDEEITEWRKLNNLKTK